jgi:hypothetical protein
MFVGMVKYGRNFSPLHPERLGPTPMGYLAAVALFGVLQGFRRQNLNTYFPQLARRCRRLCISKCGVVVPYN